MSVFDMLSSAGTGWPNELDLSVSTTATPEHLWACWQKLGYARKTALGLREAIFRQWHATEDEALKEQLWTEYESASREFHVLGAWAKMIHATCVLLEEGPEFGPARRTNVVPINER